MNYLLQNIFFQSSSRLYDSSPNLIRLSQFIYQCTLYSVLLWYLCLLWQVCKRDLWTRSGNIPGLNRNKNNKIYFVKAAGNVGQFYSQLLQFRSKVTSYKPFKWTHQSWNVAQLDLEYLFLAPFLGWGASGNIKGGSYNFRCQCNISCRISYFEIGSEKTV